MGGKLLFVHDHNFLEHDGNIYSDKLPYAVFEGYLKVFDSVKIWGRRNNNKSYSSNVAISSGDNVSYHLAENISTVKSFFGLRSSIKEILKDEISSSNAVIARLPSEYGLMAINLAHKMNKPYLVEVVACVWDSLWYYGGFAPKLYAPIAYTRMRKAVYKAHYCQYVTQDFLQRRYPANKSAQTKAISDVIIDFNCSKRIKNRFDKISKLNNKNVVFGTIGSFKTKYKGIHIAIKALSKIKNEVPNFKLRILGNGNREPYLELANRCGIENNIYFDGTLPSGNEVFEWLDEIDVYLHPSYVEGMPRSVIEAMSRGCPIVASRVGGIPELISENQLHSAGDENELADRILYLLADKTKMKSVAKNNFKNSNKFSEEKLNSKRKELLEKLALKAKV